MSTSAPPVLLVAAASSASVSVKSATTGPPPGVFSHSVSVVGLATGSGSKHTGKLPAAMSIQEAPASAAITPDHG